MLLKNQQKVPGKIIHFRTLRLLDNLFKADLLSPATLVGVTSTHQWRGRGREREWVRGGTSVL